MGLSMATGRMYRAKVWIGVCLCLIILACTLLLTGSPVLFKRSQTAKGWPVEGSPGVRVVEAGTSWLNSDGWGSGPHHSGRISDGLCYVVTEENGRRHLKLCHSIVWRFNRDSKKSSIRFN